MLGKKVVVYLKGGLGNQMFQYAFASIIAKKNNTILNIDKSFFNEKNQVNNHVIRFFELDIFNLKYDLYDSEKNNYFVKKLKSLLRKLKIVKDRKYKESTFEFSKDALSLKKPVYINGYFQSYKYFIGYEDYIRDLFTFSFEKMGRENSMILNDIRSSNSVSIHVRRGDYIEHKSINEAHGLCSLDYYHKALNTILEKDHKVKIFFFSDDIEWVQSSFNNLEQKKVFINKNTGYNSWKDMCLMSFCKHNIIANSSFSFWGAWLNSNPEKIVIAPKIWFANPEIQQKTKDLIPQEWIRF
ncbi:alpha-1,2-fucosyltransferase [Polaribacter septentrionalilitoris]|uniref:alpha-1,2-fucosyltransferase n=1 Tax=Polaribacter septentrionalilitoris TaxID=2494657 RepID=UPI00135CF438|nr:alpha-1,2-fucosyltransferase [Polaribacter septentrionalilitoris]